MCVLAERSIELVLTSPRSSVVSQLRPSNSATSAKAAGPAWRSRMRSGESASHLGMAADRDPGESGGEQRDGDADGDQG